MTVRDLRECLYEVENQEQHIDEDNICDLMSLWLKRDLIKKKIKWLREDGVSEEFIAGWINEKDKTTEEIKNYICQ